MTVPARPSIHAGLARLKATPRGPTSARQLKIDWKFPVYTPKVAEETGESRALKKRQVLSRDEAFREMAGDDPRPLLVLRECLTCTGTDDALLTKQADNEKTMLMSRWFHCVKLPPDVLESDHPFHAVFAGDDPSHLFVSSPTGQDLRPLNGAQSRTELWAVLGDALASQYRTKFEKPLKNMFKVLTELDELDNKIFLASSRLDEEIEERGPKSRKAKKIQKELAKYEKAKERLEEEVAKLSKLSLRAPKRVDDRGAAKQGV